MGTNMIIGSCIGSTPIGTLLNPVEPYNLPRITDVSVTEITRYSVIITALVTSSGYYTEISGEKGLTVEYELGENDINVIPSDADSDAVDLFVEFTIAELSRNTLYHIRLSATNENGTTYSDDIEVTTLPE